MPDCRCYSLNIMCRLNYRRLSMIRDVDDDETSDKEKFLRTSSFTTAGTRSRENERWKNSRDEEICHYTRVALLTWEGDEDETPGMPGQQMMMDIGWTAIQRADSLQQLREWLRARRLRHKMAVHRECTFSWERHSGLMGKNP